MIVEKVKFTENFKKFGFDVNDEMYEKFIVYGKLLAEWNEKINLTAITDPEGISYKHFLDSLFVFKYADIGEGASVIDVGTGAGFPGIVMKIFKPSLDITLLDSLNKRINFLKCVSENIGEDFTCIHSRAEDGGKSSELREKFDFAVARAVASLPVLCEYCLPYVKQGGYFMALKGPGENIGDAVTAVKILGGKLESAEKYEYMENERVMVKIKKISHTPIKYPRNSSQIKSKHL